MAGSTVTITGDNFDQEVVKASVPVLLDFWAPWCGPCQQLNPVIETLAQDMGESAKIGKVNVDDNRDLAVKLAVYTMPTLLFFKDGQEKERVTGGLNQETLASKLNALA